MFTKDGVSSVMDSCYEAFYRLGGGCKEVEYVKVMAQELFGQGILFSRKKLERVSRRELKSSEKRIEIVTDRDVVVVELLRDEVIKKSHTTQLIKHLKAHKKRYGVIAAFNACGVQVLRVR